MRGKLSVALMLWVVSINKVKISSKMYDEREIKKNTFHCKGKTTLLRMQSMSMDVCERATQVFESTIYYKNWGKLYCGLR